MTDSPTREGTSAPRDSPSRWRRLTRNPWFHLAAAFIVVGLILSFIAKPYVVPSGSMEQTLIPGDRVLVNRLAYVGSAPRNGDVIVFNADAAWDGPTTSSTNPLKAAARWIGEVIGFGPSGDHTLVKRVIAEPGQTARCCTAEGAVTVDGVALDEPYVYENLDFVPGALDCSTTPRSMRCFPEVTVPAGSYLVLGDHRSQSSDSAALCRGAVSDASCWRWATRGGVVGSVTAILWPVTRWRGIP